MWSLVQISALNICSFRELDYTPTQGVTTLIFGHNADNENQKSNGSGKSTLIEAIAFGITGSPLRKVRGEEIINDNAEDCYVQLRFTNSATDEMLVIEREIYRKGTSNVKCTLKCNGSEEEIAQASVDAYNKYILDKLGITRDELFSSFILSKHRYQDFLSSSDKDKKEIINRFSNGVVVDQAIDEITDDIEPLRSRQGEMELDLAGIDGRIEMLAEQIRTEEENREENERSKQGKIDAIQTTISEKRSVARESADQIEQCRQRAENIENIDKQVQALEDSDGSSLEECLTTLNSLLVPDIAPRLTDWTKIVNTKKQEIADNKAEIDKWTQIIANTRQKISTAEADLIALRSEHSVFTEESGIKAGEYSAELESLQQRLETANAQLEQLKKRKRTISGAIESLNARLAGTITCPACSHEFLVSDKDFDVDAAKSELNDSNAAMESIADKLLDNEIEAEKVEQMMSHVRNETRNLEGYKQQWNDRLAKAERAVQAAEYEMEGAQFNIKRIQDFVAARTKEIDDIRRSLFDEVYDCIDSAKRTNDRAITERKEKISAAESSIDTLRQTITELETVSGSQVIAGLKESLKTYRRKSAEVLERKTAIDAQIKLLSEQQQLFVQFKSYLANTKIEALSSMMNLILSDLGSDIRVNMSGYTMLKSGAIREKISVSLIRDGIDCGSFGKFSEGEKMRVNLSSIIAMQRLVNGNCDFGKGLDLLVIDELGDSLDETGLASTFSAINKLGLTALVVSHGLTNEGYPYKLQIVKENGESRIESR